MAGRNDLRSEVQKPIDRVRMDVVICTAGINCAECADVHEATPSAISAAPMQPNTTGTANTVKMIG